VSGHEVMDDHNDRVGPPAREVTARGRTSISRGWIRPDIDVTELRLTELKPDSADGHCLESRPIGSRLPAQSPAMATTHLVAEDSVS